MLIDSIWTQLAVQKEQITSCGRRVLVTTPIQAGLVDTPNSVMRLTSPFAIFLVLVFTLSAYGAGNREPEESSEELVSYSPNQESKSWSMIQYPKVRYSLIKIRILKHRRDTKLDKPEPAHRLVSYSLINKVSKFWLRISFLDFPKPSKGKLFQ